VRNWGKGSVREVCLRCCFIARDSGMSESAAQRRLQCQLVRNVMCSQTFEVQVMLDQVQMNSSGVSTHFHRFNFVGTRRRSYNSHTELGCKGNGSFLSRSILAIRCRTFSLRKPCILLAVLSYYFPDNILITSSV
jgi:hypothetical protein